MIYSNNNDWRVKFYKIPRTGKEPVREYLDGLRDCERAKIGKFIEYLRVNGGVLSADYSKHIRGKIWELRVDFSTNRFRVFYFLFIQKKIVLLHGFTKKTPQIPEAEIVIAEKRMHDALINQDMYE